VISQLSRPILLVILLVWLSSCLLFRENVSHGPGLTHYPGYRVDYVDAAPKPGTPVREGTRVQFTIKVRYVLQLAPTGELVLLFRDQRGNQLLREYEVSSDIKRGTSTEAMLSQEVTIPVGVWDLWLWVAVIPEGVRDPGSVLRIRYPVVRPEATEPRGPAPSASATGSAPPASSSPDVRPQPTPVPRISTAPSGRVRVLTDPAGADVYIGDLRVGTTTPEGLLLELPAGAVTVSVRMLGYSSVERILTVVPDTDVVLPITLHASPEQ
jgi:hypothetical protein